MKIRILANSLRFRLGRSEVQRFRATGAVEETVAFGPPTPIDLRYRVESSAVSDFSASFVDGAITVRVPQAVVELWAGSEQVGIEGTQKAGETQMRILIEKDFVCLHAHNDEDQSDRYPHPQAASAS